MVALPTGLGSTIDLGLGGGPNYSGATADGAQNSIENIFGPFAVGSGAEARATNTLPVNQTSQPPQNPTASYAGMTGGTFNAQTIILAAVAIVALLILKKKGVV